MRSESEMEVAMVGLRGIIADEEKEGRPDSIEAVSAKACLGILLWCVGHPSTFQESFDAMNRLYGGSPVVDQAMLLIKAEMSEMIKEFNKQTDEN